MITDVYKHDVNVQSRRKKSAITTVVKFVNCDQCALFLFAYAPPIKWQRHVVSIVCRGRGCSHVPSQQNQGHTHTRANTIHADEACATSTLGFAPTRVLITLRPALCCAMCDDFMHGMVWYGMVWMRSCRCMFSMLHAVMRT